MRVAYELARQSLPSYSSKFSRRDFTLPQLFACLAVKELLKRSYREAEALLRDADGWLRDVGLAKAPDHNTLCRAARFLLHKCRVDRVLDVAARWAAVARALGLSAKPLAVDGSYFEPRHVSRYFEFRRGLGGGNRGRRRKGKSLPKLGLACASHAHLVLACETATGASGDQPLFEPLLYHAWRRVPNRRFAAVADAGFDAAYNHRIARRDMGVRSVIPPLIGRPPEGGKAASDPHRRLMRRLLATRQSRRRCGYTQRWQAETVNSMIKRNLGSALRGRTPMSRERDMRLKVLVHNVMILRRYRGSRQSRIFT
jgi:hypothetical protein